MLRSTFVPRELEFKKAQNDQQSREHFIELNDLRFGENNSPSSGSIKKQQYDYSQTFNYKQITEKTAQSALIL